MNIKLIDGKVIEADNGDLIIDVVKKISNSLAKASLYVLIDNKAYNLHDKIVEGELKVVTKNDLIDIKLINLNAALLLKKVIEKDGNKLINLEVDEDEFIIDFEVEENLTEGNIKTFVKKALKDFLEKSDLVSNSQIILRNYIKFIEVTSISGLTLDIKANRIIGFGASNQKELENKLNEIKERVERDHRRIGKELEIFMIDDKFGKGFPIWLPNGVVLKQTIRDFILKQERKYGYTQVETPVLGSLEFYKTSGHYDHYKDSMFPVMEIEENEEYILRPMACPHHCLVYKRKPRSYKELPVRIAEQVKQYRYEASGALLGLERVRAMELTDSHIFLKMDQLKNELKNVYELISTTLNKFGIEIKYIELALHDPNDTEKYHGDENVWRTSEKLLREFLNENNIEYKEMSGEAAFYGPKIDIQIETALKHIITVSTIQLDFFLPEKFDLNYINANNELERVIMIHRGLIGTYERFISVLLEQTKGVLPMWLSPQQAVVLPVNNEAHGEYAKKVNGLLIDNDVRSIIDDGDDRLSYKIRKYQTNKTKVQIVIGDEEVKNNTVTYRYYGSEEEKTISLDNIIDLFK